MSKKMFRRFLVAFLTITTFSMIITLILGSVKDNGVVDTGAEYANDNVQGVTDRSSKGLNTRISALQQHESMQLSWLQAYAPLSPKESEEYDLVVEQIRAFHTVGRMDQNALHKFRGTVYRLRDRGLAHLGRELAMVSQETAIVDAAASVAIIDRLDALSYFAKNKDPLAIRIIADLAQRPIDWSEDGKMKEPLVNTLTLQAFEEFAKYKPDAAIAYLKNEVKPSYKAPYLYYMKMGFRRAGRSEESIQLLIASI